MRHAIDVAGAWGRDERESDVTENRALKQAVRERAARTGEKYTAARRALLAAQAPTSLTGAAGEDFDRQVATLVALGYPAAAGLSESRFTGRICSRCAPRRRRWTPPATPRTVASCSSQASRS